MTLANLSLYEDFAFSCVVDSGFKFQAQVQNLVATLVGLAGVPGSHIIVHAVADLDPDLGDWFQTLGVVVRPIQPFGGNAYCNRLEQITSLSTVDRLFVIMMDCDTVVTGPVSWPKPQRISAKPVDVAAPPRSFLSRIFEAAQLGEPEWTESDLLPGEEGRCTDRNNCNGGVYIAARSFLADLGPVWLRWARWCIEEEKLFGQYARHIDQVSLALAARELNIEIEPLHRSYNTPIHLPIPPEFDLDAQVLHYHGQLDTQLLVKSTGLEQVDAAITRVNECLVSTRRAGFLNSVFFGARYEMFPELGAGVGSQAENLHYKQNLLREMVRDPRQSVLEIGCGDLVVSSVLPVTDYLGVDIAASAIEAARRLRPDWAFLVGNAAELQLEPRDVLICFDVLIHQPTYSQYRRLAEQLCKLTQDTLIVGAYNCDPTFTSTITFYYEPISKTLADCGEFTEVSIVGQYRDTFVLVARRRQQLEHRRDLAARDFNLMSMVTDYPLSLRRVVDEARAKIGFFPAHTPRTLEYPWILETLPRNLEDKTVLDVGAGVNPLPLMLSDRGAVVFTVDSHAVIRDLSDRSDWNEWGFLDYSQIDGRITSVLSSYEDWTTQVLFDYIYCASVIEYLPAEIRRLWIKSFATRLKMGGLLLLTVALIPETDLLWDFAENGSVEPKQLHGTLRLMLEELRASGFIIEEHFVKRNIPDSRVDVAFMSARRSIVFPTATLQSEKTPGEAAQSPPGKRAAILVLGMHRSGTSSLAHLLNVLGAKLPEEVSGPGYGNPLGHWESTRLMEINEEIFFTIGRSWHDPRPIPPNWFRSKEAYHFQERIVAAIASGYENAPLILIKEPRICRLTPLYLDALDVLGMEPLIILPIRHPGEVIRSIHERNHLDPRTIEFLYLRSLLEAEEASRGCVRVWTSFEGLLDNWQITAQSIGDRLAIVWPNRLETVATEAANIFRPRHRHYRFADDPVPLPLGSLTIRAWQAAQQAMAGDESAACAFFDEIHTVVNEIDRLSLPNEEWMERRLSEANTRLATTEETVRQLQATDNANRDEIARRSAEIAQGATDVAQMQADLSALNAELSVQIQDRERLRRQIDSIHTSICWRLTWPIRYLHEPIRRIRSALLSR